MSIMSHWHYYTIVLLGIATSLSMACKEKRRVCRYDFTLTYGSAAPDNYINPTAILINGAFPGPTIRCGPNDRLIVKVRNLLDHVFAMHWHGIQQRDTKNADGVPGVTQQPIPVNGTYKYVININGQHGTFAYHAHVRLDIIWALGALILDDTALVLKHGIKYDCDHNILISQCWHRDVQQLYFGVVGAPLQLPPTADSVLINGISYGNWSTNNANTDGYQVFTVKRGQTCRFRFIAMTDDRACICFIENHSLTVFEADGNIVKQVNTSYVQVNVLERYSVLVRMDQPTGNYHIRCMFTPGSGPNNGVAILHYEGAADPTPLRKNSGVSSVVANQTFGMWIVEQIPPVRPQPLVYKCPNVNEVCEEIHISATFSVNSNGSGQFLVNNQSLITEPAVNYLSQIESGVDISGEPGIVTLKLGCAYLFIFQNLPLGPFCAQHPFHLHGMTFYVVAYGQDKYNPVTDRPKIQSNIDNNRIAFRDIFALFPNVTNATNTQFCGWTAIMLVANNPGVWLTHCHISDHMLLGKQFIIYIKDYECAKSGTFRDPSDCKKYIPCVKDMCGHYYQFPRLTCPKPLFYSERTSSCEPLARVPECEEQAYCSPYNPHKLHNPDNDYAVADKPSITDTIASTNDDYSTNTPNSDSVDIQYTNSYAYYN